MCTLSLTRVPVGPGVYSGAKSCYLNVFWSYHTDHERAVHKTGRDSAIYFSKTIGKLIPRAAAGDSPCHAACMPTVSAWTLRGLVKSSMSRARDLPSYQ